MMLRFKIRSGIGAVDLFDEGEIVRADQDGGQLLIGPDVEQALAAAAVRAEGGIKSTSRRSQLAGDKLQRLFQDAAVHRFLRQSISLGVDLGKLGVVVKHLLEMRNGPGAFRAVAMEAAA